MNENLDNAPERRQITKDKIITKGLLLKMEYVNGGVVLIHTADVLDANTNQVIKDYQWLTGVMKYGDKFGMFTTFNHGGDGIDDAVFIPDEVAIVIKAALYLEYRRWRIKKGANELENKTTGKVCYEMNCTKFIAYALGLVSLEESGNITGWGEDDVVPFYKIEDYKIFNNFKDISEYIKEGLGTEKFGVCQSINNKTNKVHHSFFVGISNNSEKILCFEKNNMEEAPFRIIPLQEIFEGSSEYSLRYAVKSFSTAKKIINKDPRIKTLN
jgi:hypothetical protein